ncbi:MAG: alpha/beta fold hydrolase [Sandaracinaceae bacterium]|nr:alpha/beta fold hydrolase [Sandaracinaceae bacterium]
MRRWIALSLWFSVAGCACDGGSGSTDASVRDARVDARAQPDAAEVADASIPRDAPPDGGRDAARLGAPYPIVFAHGFFGFEDFAGIDFVTYYYGVRADLAAHGESQVFTPAVDPFNDSETRGRALLAHIENVIAETGHARVNIIAHSQGGLDARVAANLRPDLIASITTISTPHEGTPVSDVILRIVSDERLQDLVDAVVRLVAAPLWDAAGAETSVFAPLRLFSRDGIAAFEAMHPDEPTVQYFSIAGRSDRALAASLCRVSDRPDFLRRYDDVTDPVDILLSVPEAIIDNDVLDPTPNDGLVPVESARRGRFLGCIPADHLDEIGQLLGDSPGLFNDFDHLAFYRDLVAFLRAQGL